MTKPILYGSYVVLVVVMAIATLLENCDEALGRSIYASPLFAAAWAVLAAASVVVLWRACRSRRSLTFYLLHAALLVILVGALVTRLGSHGGRLHLRIGETAYCYMEAEDGGRWHESSLPYALRLDTFNVVYHEGTAAPVDYVSHLTVIDGGKEQKAVVSMNRILSYKSIRFYQTSYDEDGRGSVFTLYADPAGIAVSYAGYALLIFSLIWMLFDPRGAYRRLLRHPLLGKGLSVAIVAAAAMFAPQRVQAQTALPEKTARDFCRLQVVYNDRVCPLQTFAIDFTKKICGSRSYNGLTAEQVLSGCIFWGDEWAAEPFIRISSSLLRSRLSWPENVAAKAFFGNLSGAIRDDGYALTPYLLEYYHGVNDKFHRDIAKTDEQVMLFMELRRGTLLRMFPHGEGGRTVWYAPTDRLPSSMSEGERLFVQNFFNLLYQEAKARNYAAMGRLIDKMHRYQLRNAGRSMPLPVVTKAETVYNSAPWVTILFICNLALGFLALGLTLARILRRNSREPSRFDDMARKFFLSAAAVAFLALTLVIALRWTIGGTVPLNNGYETMLAMAWFIQLFAFVFYRRFHIVLAFGLLLSGFFLLVSHISLMDPQITHRMPVLNSPLLSLHVSVIMMAYALLSLTFLCGTTALIVRLLQRDTHRMHGQLLALQLLSRLLLYPAVAALGTGIFVGAIWANVSWGQYWSWDPKETWALITFMVYAVALHPTLIRRLNAPLAYHAFMVFAFLALLMTYFGVNYLLGGMHSYA